MFARLLAALFRFITSRELFLLLGLGLAVITAVMLVEQVRFVRDFAGGDAKEAEGIVDGLAGVLVAAGVFLEGREILRKMGGASEDTVEARLNEVAAQNGMGILIVGLLREISTLLIGLPPRVLDTRGYVRPIFGACALLSVLTLAILYDFVKDYALTYKLRREALKE
jgi:hypothetical protein